MAYIWKTQSFCIVLAMLLATIAPVFSQTLEQLKNADTLRIQTETGEFDTTEDEIHLKKGKNRLEYGPAAVEAEEIWFNKTTTAFRAVGNVKATLSDGTVWTAPEVKGNLKENTLDFEQYSYHGPIWHSTGKGGSVQRKLHTHTLEDATLTTCELDHPHYYLRASSASFDDVDKTFSAKYVKLYFWDVPVFWFPYAWGTTDKESGWIFVPGYSGMRGAFLRIGRGSRLRLGLPDEGYYSQFGGHTQTYVDLMTRRGIALGHDTELTWPAMRRWPVEQSFQLNAYALRDRKPTTTEGRYDRRFKEQKERYRAHLFYQARFDEETVFNANIDSLSDISMLEDWFHRDYRRMPQPRSYLTFNHTSKGLYGLNLSVSPRINTFYTHVESLPVLSFDLYRTRILDLPIETEQHLSAGYYSMKWRNFERSRRSLINPLIYNPQLHRDNRDYDAFRFDYTAFLYAPITYKDIMELIPRVGIRTTYYNRSSKRRISRRDIADMIDVDDPDHVYSTTPIRRYDRRGGDVLRLAYEVGAEWSMRMYSDWANADLTWLDGSGVRHVLRPFVNYTYIPEPSHSADHLYYFDEVDRLAYQHFIRFGLDQQLQTRVDNVPYTFLRLRNYIDQHFQRGEESRRHTGDFGTRVDVYPTRKTTVWGTLVHEIGEGDIHRAEAGIRYGREKEAHFSTRYLFRNRHFSRTAYSMGTTLDDLTGESSYTKKYFEKADIIRFNGFLPLNDITSVEAEIEYDFHKSNLSEHRYVLNRELHCWLMSIGAGWRNSDFEMMVMFRLKAYPSIKVDLNI